MLSTRSFRPLRTELDYSRALLYYLLASHAVALIATFVLMCQFIYASLLVPLIIYHGILFHRRFLSLTLDNAVRSIKWLDEHRWVLLHNNGDAISVSLVQPAFVTSFLIILKFRERTGSGKYTVLLTPDGMDKAIFHQLHVRLITQRATLSSCNV